MIRELFSIGSLSISPFGILLVAAFLIAYAQLRSALRISEIGTEDDANALLFSAGLGGIVGAKIYYAMLYGDWRFLFDRSGLVWYGGFLVGLAAVAWVIRRRQLPGWATADALAPSLALGYGIGRIGCFLVGDDYGVPTELPWGVRFPVGLPPTTAGWLRSEFGIDIPASVADETLMAVHPTQLYESLIALAIGVFGIWLLKARAPAGGVALAVVGLLAAERFLVEFLRAKDDRFFGSITLAQIISLAVLAAVVWLWLARRSSEG